MDIIKINKNENGAHDNQSWPDSFPIPEGYAKISEKIGSASNLKNYPFGDLTIEVIDNAPTVINWAPLPIPSVENEVI